MAICLDYQAVYCVRQETGVSMRAQIFAALILLVALSAKIWIKVVNTDLGYQLARERNKTVTLDMERRELELQLSVMMREDNLVQMAKERLGLARLDGKQALRLRY